MSNTDDKPLHDWVRQSLAGHQPAYDAQDWLILRARMRRRRWRMALTLSCLCLLAGVAGYVVVSQVSGRDKPQSVKATHALGTLTADRKQGVVPEASSSALPPPVSDHYVVEKSPVQPKVAASTRPTLSADLVGKQGENALETEPAIGQVRPIQQIRQPIWSWPAVVYRPLSAQEVALTHKLLSGSIGADSTVVAGLTRNLHRWPNAVIVCDLTTSMDPFATQVYAWFRRNAANTAILGTVFFTDCDSLGQETQAGGPPGAFFATRERDARLALPTLLAAARNTVNNRLGPENVVEALQYAQRTFPEARHLILIADNGSGVKDMALLPHIKLPVHVIACDTQTGYDYAFEPNQYEIASQTGGSVHTLADDLRPGKVPNNTFVRVGAHYFRYVARKNQFIKTNHISRPVRLLGINW